MSLFLGVGVSRLPPPGLPPARPPLPPPGLCCGGRVCADPSSLGTRRGWVGWWGQHGAVLEGALLPEGGGGGSGGGAAGMGQLSHNAPPQPASPPLTPTSQSHNAPPTRSPQRCPEPGLGSVWGRGLQAFSPADPGLKSSRVLWAWLLDRGTQRRFPGSGRGPWVQRVSSDLDVPAWASPPLPPRRCL